jgi:hypothetical protein
MEPKLDAGEGVDGEEFFEQLRKRVQDLRQKKRYNALKGVPTTVSRPTNRALGI